MQDIPRILVSFCDGHTPGAFVLDLPDRYPASSDISHHAASLFVPVSLPIRCDTSDKQPTRVHVCEFSDVKRQFGE